MIASPVRLALSVVACCGVGLVGCGRARQTYRTTAEITRLHAFGRDPKAPGMMDVELKYTACPGDARKVVRGDRAFAACGLSLAEGQKVEVDVTSTFNAERGNYRSEITRIGTCELKTDPKDEANYEHVEDCVELKMTGNAVGVRCNRTRNAALVAKCPWLRRN